MENQVQACIQAILATTIHQNQSSIDIKQGGRELNIKITKHRNSSTVLRKLVLINFELHLRIVLESQEDIMDKVYEDGMFT